MGCGRDRGNSAVGLAAAVVGAVDPVDAAVPRAAYDVGDRHRPVGVTEGPDGTPQTFDGFARTQATVTDGAPSTVVNPNLGSIGTESISGSVTLDVGFTGPAFVSAGGYHHHIGLNTWESEGGPPPPRGTTGLYHVAIRYPDRPALADALRRLLEADVPIDGASDHGVSEALYLRDPDENGVELYWDRPRDQWPVNQDGSLAMHTRRLDVQALLSEGSQRRPHQP